MPPSRSDVSLAALRVPRAPDLAALRAPQAPGAAARAPQAPSAGGDPGRPTAEELRRTFDSTRPYTLGIEDEVMLVDPGTLELAPRAAQVLELVGEDPFKLELPAAQIEIVVPPQLTVAAATAALRRARRELAERAAGLVLPIAAGVHPLSSGVGELNTLPRYAATIARYGHVARRQLVCACQVHVAVGSARGALAVYNAARSYLPLLAALAANSPYYEGTDSGLASVRPKLTELLPRQGVPPVIESWEDLAESFRWGEAAGGHVTPRTWWWELRLHPAHGTLEFRVPDAQCTVEDTAAVAALIHALVAWLAEQHVAGEPLAVVSDWRIAENRWSACRDGVTGEMADLHTGELRPTRAWLADLFGALAPVADRLGCRAELEHARSMSGVNGALAQRRVGDAGGPRAVAAWLAGRFAAG